MLKFCIKAEIRFSSVAQLIKEEVPFSDFRYAYPTIPDPGPKLQPALSPNTFNNNIVTWFGTCRREVLCSFF